MFYEVTHKTVAMVQHWYPATSLKQCHNQEDHNMHLQYCENLKSCTTLRNY